MGAEKIIKLSSDNELRLLQDKVDILESVIQYSTAEQIKSLKDKCDSLEKEAIALRATSEHKDRLVEAKEQIIKTMKAQSSASEAFLRQQLESEYREKVNNAKKNIEYFKVKPEKEKTQAVEQERDRIKEMYESLLNHHNQSHTNETTIISMISEVLEIVKYLVKSGATADEIVSQIDCSKEKLNNIDIYQQCEQIHNLLRAGNNKTTVAELVYPGLGRGKQKVSERIRSKQYLELFGEAEQLLDIDRR